MKRLLVLILCCAWGTAVAQNISPNAARDWIRKLQSEKGNEWRRYTDAAKVANNQTYTSLYIYGQYIASFSDDGTCRAQINDLIRESIAETFKESDNPGVRALDRAARQNPKNDFARADAELKAQITKDIESLCSCRRVQNPNYDPNALSIKIEPAGSPDPFGGADPSSSGGGGGGLLDVAPVRQPIAAATADVDQMLASMDIDKMVGSGANPPPPPKPPKSDDGAVAYVGESRTPIYSFKVNTQIDEPVKDYKWDVRLAEPPKASQIILKHMKASMTDEQYDNLRAYWWNSETGTEPNYVGTNNGTYYFEDGNTRYEVTPNRFFTPAVSIKRSSIDGKYDLPDPTKGQLSTNGEAKAEVSIAAIMPDGKIVSLNTQAEAGAGAGAGAKVENSGAYASNKAGVAISGSRQLAYSSGPNIELDKDGKIGIYKMEAKIIGKLEAGISQEVTIKKDEMALSVPLVFDVNAKKESDGFSGDGYVAGYGGGLTVTDNEKSARARIGLTDALDAGGEIAYKKVELTDAFRNDPAAVTRYLKKEIESSKKIIGVISQDRITAEKNGTINLAGAFEQQEKAKIETYNKLITEIEKTGSTDSVMR